MAKSVMQFWIAKAKRPTAIVAAWLQRGTTGTWWTKRRPTKLKPHDRLFIWKGGNAPFLIGVGECLSVRDKRNRAGDYTFLVRYVTEAFEPKLTIDLLRRDPFLKNASFLKVGPAGTLFSLSQEQGRHLEVLARRSRLIDIRDLQQVAGNGEEPIPDLDIPTGSAELRERKLRAHLRKERSSALRKARLAIARQQGELRCEVCNVSFTKLPPGIGESCCEVHHKIPVASLVPGALVRLKDLAVVCSNCHRMIHSKNPPYSPTQLSRKLIKARS